MGYKNDKIKWYKNKMNFYKTEKMIIGTTYPWVSNRLWVLLHEIKGWPKLGTLSVSS